MFLIVLSDRGFRKSFGAGASAGYLGGALRRQGELIYNYYAVAGAPLANEIALTSGQGPTAQTASDCPAVSPIKPGRKGPRGQILGAGCVYPAATPTLAGQLSKAGDSWKAYFQGVSTSSATACKVPKLGSKEPQTAHTRDSYLTWRNPFVYFRSLTSGGGCASHEVGLGQLATDLKSAGTTPSLVYIVPSPCSDGSEAPCKRHTSPRLAGANRFLKSVVRRSSTRRLQGRRADRDHLRPGPADGTGRRPERVLRPVFLPEPGQAGDAAGGAARGDGSRRDNHDRTDHDPDTRRPPIRPQRRPRHDHHAGHTRRHHVRTGLGGDETTPTSGGGGQVGLLLISQYVKPDSADVIDYFNHFSLLGSIEKLFGLHRLGYAGTTGLPVFSTGVFNNTRADPTRARSTRSPAARPDGRRRRSDALDGIDRVHPVGDPPNTVCLRSSQGAARW